MRFTSAGILGLAAAIDPAGFLEALDRLDGRPPQPQPAQRREDGPRCGSCGCGLLVSKVCAGTGICGQCEARAPGRARYAAKLARRAARNRA